MQASLTMHLPTRQGKATRALTLLLLLVPVGAQAANEDTSSINDCKADEIVRFRGGTARLENDLFTGTDHS